MVRYAILLNQGHNRVYFEASKKLSLAELEIASKNFLQPCDKLEIEEIKGNFYVSFSVPEKLCLKDLCILSKLSFVYAIFEIRDINNEVFLYPIQKDIPQYFNEDISMILKYSGKTNELFTKMLINIAVNSSNYFEEEHISLLDPIAGKGTTLFEGLINGYNAYGIEISPNAVQESVNYFKKYLETEKYKHEYQRKKLSGENKSFSFDINSFQCAKSKEDLKNGRTLTLDFASGDSKHANKLYKKNFFHVIVGDLPYGVQHGSVSNQKQSLFTRNPSELLSTCLPSWKMCLKPGGTMVFAWNKFVLNRKTIEELFTNAGLTVLNTNPYDQLEHRVDQSINRDIIVAKKV